MKLIQAVLNKDTYKIDIDYIHPIGQEITIVISDLEFNVPYFSCKQVLHQYNSIWVVPLNQKQISILKNNKNFPGFYCKVYVDTRLEQVEELRTNDVPYTHKHFLTDISDFVGNSYVDFFYGNLCDGIDFSGTVIDAGANVGFFTLLAKEKGANKIYSIEPDARPFFYLERNFKNDSSITLINKALTTSLEGTKFYYALAATVANSQYGGENFIEDFVPTITLDSILNIENKINLVKLDIEGSEFDVIAKLTPRHFEKINQFFIEFHDISTAIKMKLLDNGYKIEYRESTELNNVGFIYAYKYENS